LQDGIEIKGAGLAGCCLAWQLASRGVKPRLFDSGWPGAASRVAAGLVNPVTGKNFQPSWRIETFLPEATAFFSRIGEKLGIPLWHPLPVHRLVDVASWPKVARKLDRPEVARWVESVEESSADWRAVVVLKGGGRLDVPAFCGATRKHFESTDVRTGSGPTVHCGGAAELLAGRLGAHRCAKGEILTVRIVGGDASRILVGAGGWLVPVGGDLFKAGANYVWDELDGTPSPAGKSWVEGLLERLGIGDFEVVAHEAGVRPIVRRSMPLIGRVAGEWVFNGLGSKGALYAPGVARQLAEALVDASAIDADLDVRNFLGETG
jgi:glycine/D-amino acid oxidase-like deaminating enzyme